MKTQRINRSQAKPRELEPLAPIADAKEGPAMQALPNERWREFVRQWFIIKGGNGAGIRAARAAGFQGTPQSLWVTASRLMHDDRILSAMREYGEQFLKGSAPAALKALHKLIATPSHKGHERAVATVIDRMYPVENVLSVKHEHNVTPAFQNTAQVMARMTELAAKFGAPMPALPAPVVIENDEAQPCK
jgi:phage terminase small subunit